MSVSLIDAFLDSAAMLNLPIAPLKPAGAPGGSGRMSKSMAGSEMLKGTSDILMPRRGSMVRVLETMLKRVGPKVALPGLIPLRVVLKGAEM